MNYYDFLNDITAKYGDKTAITCGDKSVTYKQLKRSVDKCALHFIDCGMNKGDRVVLWAVNTIEYVTTFYGILEAGGIAVLMNYGLSAEDTGALTKMVGASWAILGGNKVSQKDPMAAAECILEAGVEPEHLRMEGIPKELLIKAGVPAEMLDVIPSVGDITCDDLDADGAKRLAERAAQVDTQDTQVIIFTTGTTALPKAVQLSPGSMLNDAKGAIEVLRDDIVPSLCLALPLFHSYGLLVMQIFLMLGNHLIMVPLFQKPELLIAAIDQHKVRGLASVGAIYGMLTRHEDFESKIKGNLKTIITGGGFTTPVEMMRLENAFGGDARILCGYVQTECSPVISVEKGSDPLERRAVSVGHVLPGLDVRIWRIEDGFVPQGEIGEVVVKGYNTCNGYYGLPEDKQPFDKDGWLHTGDMGRFADDGMLQLTGRIKDIIIRCGENISPLDVEQAILQESVIREVKVLGAPHPMWGESVEACIVLNNSDKFDEDALRKALKSHLAPYKIPSHFFIYPAFPLNENGKLDQRSLRASMLNRLMEHYIASSLDEGLRILHISLKNKPYSIAPITGLAQELAEQLKFSSRQALRIRLAVEEMLTERINNAYEENGEIEVDIMLMPQWLRIRFVDTGKAYRLDAPDASISAKIILHNVDGYFSRTDEHGKAEYCLDYQYIDDFDVKAYLMRHSKTGA